MTDAWYVCCPKNKEKHIRAAVETLTYRELDGVDCDDICVKISTYTTLLRDCSPIDMNGVTPPVHETVEGNPSKLLNAYDDILIVGGWGTGKSHALRWIAQEYRKFGNKVYIVAFCNKQCVKFEDAMTVHKFCKLVQGGKLELPCTVIWDEVFQPNIFIHARMAQFRTIPDVQWIFAGDPLQCEFGGHWRGQVCVTTISGAPRFYRGTK